MDYELYHDESQVGGYWHGMLLVPIPNKSLLCDYLHQARQNTGYSEPISLKKVRGQGRLYDCVDAWIQLGVAALMSRTKGEAYPIFLGQRNARRRKQYDFFKHCIGAKFVLFCERDNLAKMVKHADHASKVETTFRMGLKGGLHYLGAQDEVIRIEKIHFDGYEHYHRHLDHGRIVGRLTGLRDYCSISLRQDLIDDRSGNHKRPDSQPYDDCQLLQLADLLVGCFRTVLQQQGNPFHQKLAYSIQQLISRYQEGYARMRNSRWFNSFCMSQCYLESGSWRFDTIECERQIGILQMTLPFQ
jgi:hypothetical protein